MSAEEKSVVSEAQLRGVGRLMRATKVSLRALKWGLLKEEAIRLELLMVVVFTPLGLWLGQSGVERALLVGVLLIALIVELLNTAIETVVDRIGVERHELSGLAKDLGSAAVLSALILAGTAWLVVLWGRW